MAGFLNKKSRLIDYKLTENGRFQLASGDIRFKYYTFSDRSINYESKIDNNKVISDAEFYYLPFEVTTNPGILNNPEYYLSNELSYENKDRNIFQLKDVAQTLGKSISDQRYLTEKRITNSNVKAESDIFYDNLSLREEIDFLNNRMVRRYPTIKYVEESINDLKKVNNDNRFSNHIKNKRMSPVSSSGQEILQQNESQQKNSVDFVFKTLDLNNNITSSDGREDIICKAIKTLEKNKDRVFNFEYQINSSYISSNDVFNFEIHEIVNEESLKKLPVVNLGIFFDKASNKFIKVYLIGKFIKKNSIDEFKNYENKVYNFEEVSNYYFINLFTLVVE